MASPAPQPVALIAGARGAIGSAVASLLAERGMTLWLGTRRIDPAMRKLVERLREHGGRVEVATLQATDPQSISSWAESARRELGRIDVLANCLGWHGQSLSFRPFAEQEEAHWLQVLTVELIAAMRLIRSVLPQMSEQGYGRIVTVASDSAKVGQAGIAGNAAARGGCVAFSKSIAREVGRHGITVNLVCPGPIESSTLEEVAREADRRIVERMASMTALKRVGTAREVAQVVAFLASPEAGYVTGQAISVSGGLTMC